MSLKPETKQLQEELAWYCRTGELKPIEGANAERLPHYRRLVFNVLKQTMSTAYPITKNVLDKEEWDQLMQDYFVQYDPKNPQVWKMPKELVDFVDTSDYGEKLQRPYLSELLYFEWLEIEVHTREDEELPNYSVDFSDFNKKMIINPYHSLVHLTYPVHSHKAEELKTNRGSYFILVYREIESGAVHFLELPGLFAIIFELMKTGLSFQDAFNRGIEKMQMQSTEALAAKVTEFLNTLITKGIVLGTSD